MNRAVGKAVKSRTMYHMVLV